VLKDFLALRPALHYTEKRVRGHVAICVLAAVLEAVMSIDLKARKLTDPDLEGQHLTARRGLRELERIRMVRFSERRPTTSGRTLARVDPHRDIASS
jgi:transposase